MTSLKNLVRSWLGITADTTYVPTKVEPVKLEVTDPFYLNDEEYFICHLYRWIRFTNDRTGTLKLEYDRTGTLKLEYVKGQPSKGLWDYRCPKCVVPKKKDFYRN